MTIRHNILIETEAGFTKYLVWKGGNGRPVNLTDWTALLQVRSSAQSPEVLLELSTENGGITLLGTTGVILIRVTANQTKDISFSTGVYDLLLIPPTGRGTFERRLIGGKVNVSFGVTK